jgi:peptide deformylase
MLQIVKYPDPILKTRASEVTKFDGEGCYRLSNLTNNMQVLCTTAEGVGLAAPQVGVSERIIIAARKDPSGLHLVYYKPMINPRIVKSEGLVWSTEGCLSMPGLQVKIDRKTNITVTYQTDEGIYITEDLQDTEAIIVQHEIDHLDGILITDHLSNKKKKAILENYHA